MLLVVSVLAIWPVVTDAPWEDSAPVPVIDRTREIRCEGAFRLRASAAEGVGNATAARQVQFLLGEMDKAQQEIARYC